MRVLIIGTTDKRGGAASVGWNIAKYARSQGNKTNFIVGYKESRKDSVEELPKPPLTKYLDQLTGKNITSLYRNFRSFLLANDIDFGVKSEILNHRWYKKADLVHFHNLHGGYFKLSTLKKISGEKPVVWTLHDMWAMTGHSVYSDNPKVWREGEEEKVKMMEYPPMLWNNNKYLWNKKRKIYKDSKLNIVTPSGWLMDIVEESILSEVNKQLIHNGVNTEVFHPVDKSRARKKLNLPEDKKIALFVAYGGARQERKGWEFTKKAVEKMGGDVLFVSLGGGEDKSNSKNNIQHVSYVEDKSRLNLYYNAADLFLFTSLAENCPLVVIEALSTGLPVVSFDVGGVKEIIKHNENGYIAEYKKVNDLVKGMERVLKMNKDEIMMISRKNRQRAEEEFSIQAMGKKYLDLYREILQSGA